MKLKQPTPDLPPNQASKDQAAVATNSIKMPKRVVKVSKPSNFYLLIIGFIIIGLWLVSMHAAIVFLFGMLPGVIAAIIDQERDKSITKIISTFNFVGVLPFTANVIKNINSSSYGAILVADPATWMIIYSAAAFGWAVYWLAPQLAVFLYKIKVQNKLIQLNSEMNELVTEWGEGIRGGSKASDFFSR